MTAGSGFAKSGSPASEKPFGSTGAANQQAGVSGEDLLKGAKAPVCPACGAKLNADGTCPNAQCPSKTGTQQVATPPVTPVTPPPGTQEGTTPPAATATQPAATPQAAAPKKLTPEQERKIDNFLKGSQRGAKPGALPVQPAVKPSADGTPGEFKSVEQLVEEGDVAGAIRVAATEEKNRTLQQLHTDAEVQRWHDRRYQANKKVYIDHPELLEVDSGVKKFDDEPFAQTMKSVYDEYPNLLEMPEGPILAMEIAEKRLGVKKEATTEVNQAKQEGAQAEAARQNQTRASAALASSSQGAPPAANVGAVELSDSEKTVAVRLGLTEVDYGKYKGRKPMFDANYYSKHSGGPRPKR